VRGLLNHAVTALASATTRQQISRRSGRTPLCTTQPRPTVRRRRPVTPYSVAPALRTSHSSLADRGRGSRRRRQPFAEAGARVLGVVGRASLAAAAVTVRPYRFRTVSSFGGAVFSAPSNPGGGPEIVLEDPGRRATRGDRGTFRPSARRRRPSAAARRVRRPGRPLPWRRPLSNEWRQE